MNQEEILALFEREQALLKGHFELASGLHSERYLQCALLLQHPRLAESLCRQLAQPWLGDKIDVVIGPAAGGIILAYELARALGARSIFMERKGDGPLLLRRGFAIHAGENVLAAEDVMTTGGSVAEIVAEVERRRARLAGIACLVDRGGAQRFAQVRVAALLQVEIPTFAPELCPMCRAGVPIEKPGSQQLRRPSSIAGGA